MESKILERTTIEEIVHNVRIGIRTKADLKRCNCENCIKALKILNKR